MKNRTDLLKESWRKLLAHYSFVLACHQRPDGDTLGSALGLAHVLRLHGKDVVVVSEDGVPENYRFIPESETVERYTDRRDFDIGMLVDSEGVKRIGSAADAVMSARVQACVDHHVQSSGFGEIRVIDEDASSTAEVLFELLEVNGVHIDVTAATQLLTGLIADTGAFRFANTAPRTFHIAARLTDIGAKPSVIAREVFDNRPMKAMKLLGRALNSLEVDPGGSVVWARITANDLDELGAKDEDTDGIVNNVTKVRGPKVALLFREIGNDLVRVSLRSHGGVVDVNKIANVFEGGGHVAAAGCTVHSPLDEAIRRVVDEVLKWTES